MIFDEEGLIPRVALIVACARDGQGLPIGPCRGRIERVDRGRLSGRKEGEQVRGGLFKSDRDPRGRMRGPECVPPLFERFGREIELRFGEEGALGKVEQRERCGAVRTVERNEQIVTRD